MNRFTPWHRTIQFVATAIFLLTSACVSPVRRGELAAEAGDLTGALAAWETGAQDGNAHAQFLVGLCHEEGKGTAVNPTAAAAWYEQSAQQGFAPAQNNLGLLHFRGRGVPRDPAAAALWFARAADQGFAPAQCNRGVLFLLGQGEERDVATATEWLRRAAEQGDGRATRLLRVLEREATGLGEFQQQLAERVCTATEDVPAAPR